MGVIILWENPNPPIPATDTAVPQWYSDLAQEEEPFAVLELPFHKRGFDKLYMYYQTVHNKPILVGHVSRLPQDAFSFLDSVPFLEPFNSIYTWNVVEESWVDFADKDVTRQFDLLAAEDVRYIVLNKPLIAEGHIDRWRDWVTFEPFYEDDEVLVYATSPQAGEEFDIVTRLADSIGLIRASFAPQEANQGGVVKADIRWASSGQPERDYQVCFYLVDDQGETAAAVCEEPAPGWPTSDWGANAVARGDYVVPIDSNLPPGSYRIDMALASAGEQEAVGEVAAIGELSVTATNPRPELSLCWAGDLCLRGVDVAQDAEQIDLDLLWQAAAPLDESYKRFVHLVDPQADHGAVQNDAVPRSWSYPTDIWEPNEMVADRLSLPLDGVPPGSYELRTGWYAVDGGLPLAACPTGDCREQTADYQLVTTLVIP